MNTKVNDPPEAEGLRRVSKEEFFSKIGPMDVNPSITQSKWDNVTGYTSLWVDRYRRIQGVSDGGIVNGVPSRFWLTPTL